MYLDDIDLSNAQEPEVVRAVLKDIKAIGDNNRRAYDGLRQSFEGLKQQIDSVDRSGDYIIREQVNRYAEDLITCQSALDNLNRRIDRMESDLGRPVFVDGHEIPRDNASLEFFLHCQSLKNDEGINWRNLPHIIVYDAKQYQEYKETFIQYCISPDPKMLTPEQQKTLMVGVDPQGDYACPPEISNRISKRLYEMDPVRALADVVTISKSSYEELVDWGDADAEWESETSTDFDETTPEWKKLAITPHGLKTRPKASLDFLEDSIINAEDWLARKIADRFLRTEGSAFVTGDGVGKPRGYTTYTNGTDYGQVEQINMGAAAALTADGFYNVKFGMIEYFMNRGTWVMNRTTLRDAVKLKDGVGRYLWQPGFSAMEPATIAGLPYRLSPTMPAVAANTLSVVLADWREAYLIVDRIGISMLRDPYTDPPYVRFFTRKRVGGAVRNPQAIKIGKLRPRAVFIKGQDRHPEGIRRLVETGHF